jgi:hypothetical protein
MKKIIFSFLLSLFLIQGAYAVEKVDAYFVPSSGNLQRNQVVDVDVYLNAPSQIVLLAGVELNFNYNALKFKTLPTLQFDGITSSLFVNEVDLSVPGTVTYRKALSNPIYITLTPGVPFKAFTLRFKITSANAQQGSTTFAFKAVNGVSNRAGQDVKGIFSNGIYNIVADTTAPIVISNPNVSTTFNAGSVVPVSLLLSGSDLSGDLDKIYYTLNGSNPSLASSVYSAPLVLANNVPNIIKFIGVDKDGNQSAVQTRSFYVDTNSPQVLAYSLSANLLKQGAASNISFSVSKPLMANPNVSIDGRSASLISGIYPNYVYRYVAVGNEVQSSRNVTIAITDTAGNTVFDTSKQIKFDFVAPHVAPLGFTPNPAVIGQNLSLQFSASEPLDTAQTVVAGAGHLATFQSKSGLNYMYQTQTALTGSERSRLVRVIAVDLAGNSSDSAAPNNRIVVSGRDVIGNVGVGLSSVSINYNEK